MKIGTKMSVSRSNPTRRAGTRLGLLALFGALTAFATATTVQATPAKTATHSASKVKVASKPHAVSKAKAGRIAVSHVGGGHVVRHEGTRGGTHVVHVKHGRKHYRVHVGTRTGRVVQSHRIVRHHATTHHRA